MASPTADALLIGGASILFIGFVFAFDLLPINAQLRPLLIAITILVNWPHFVGSYRLLYTSRASVLAHRWAAIYFPAMLLGAALYCLATFETNPFYTNALVIAGGLYAARHYTGQAWGMMASFALIDGTRIEPRERMMVTRSLDLMMLWHMLWAANNTFHVLWPQAAAPAAAIYAHAHWVAITSFALGGTGIFLLGRRLGRLPPLRVLLPWVSIYCWYALLYRDHQAVLAIQCAHALQYLVFPARVLKNRSAQPMWRSYLVWVLIGAAIFEGLGPVFSTFYRLAGGGGTLPTGVVGVVLATLGIHHYFIDGALYKLRNPEVRSALFAHLESAPPTPSAPELIRTTRS